MIKMHNYKYVSVAFVSVIKYSYMIDINCMLYPMSYVEK